MSRPAHGGNLVWAASVAGCHSSELLDFSASISPLGPPQSVIDALRADFLYESSVLTAYPDPNYGDLRDRIAQHHDLPVEVVLPGNGAAELLNWAIRDLSAQRACFCLSPGFGDYARAFRAFDAQPIFLSLPTITLAAIQSWLQQIETYADMPLDQCGLLINNPHNPTAGLFERDRILPLLNRFGLIVIDEAFMDFLPPEQSQSLDRWVLDYPNLVVIRSLTKFYSMPGLRLGYALAHPDKLDRWRSWRDAWPVNSLAAMAGEMALTDKAFAEASWQWLAKENPYLYAGLNEIEGLDALPSQVNFFLVQCAVSVSALQRVLLQRDRIYIRDCHSFEGLGDRYFRVAVKGRSDNQRLLAALRAALLLLSNSSEDPELSTQDGYVRSV